MTCRPTKDHIYESDRKLANGQSSRVSPLPSPSSKKTTNAEMIDHLSGETYKPQESPRTTEKPPSYPPSIFPPSPTTSSSSPFYTRQPLFDEPPPRSISSTNPLPATPRDAQSPGSLPPPPSRYNQRQQYFEQQKAVTGGTQQHPHLGNGYSSYDNIVGHTKNLTLSPSTPTRSAEHEEALFKDLLDFAKTKSTSSSKSNRPF